MLKFQILHYMKNNFPHCLKISFILLLVSVAISCNLINNTDASIDELLVKASYNLKKHPDSTLKTVNKLLVLSTENAIDDEKQLALYQLKQRAFLRLQLMDSVYVTGEKIREIASRIPDSLAIAETLVPLYGNVDYKYLKEAKKLVPGAINTFEKNKKYYEKGMVTALYGVILRNEGDYKKSQNYFIKALKILETTDSIKAIGRIYISLGNNFASAKIMDKSTFYYRKALKIEEIKKDSLLHASILLNLGINFRTSNPDSAVVIYKRALELLARGKNDNVRMKLEYNLANVYFDKAEFTKAEEIYKRILDLATKTNSQEGIVMSSASLGNVYNAKNQYALSISYFNKALKILEATDQKSVLILILPELINVYKKNGNSNMTIHYYDQLIKLKDSLLTTEKTKSILELEKKYQTEKKEIVIENLEAISNLRLFILYGLSFFVMILFFVLRKQKKLYREKQYSYALLMQQYKSERLEKLGNFGETFRTTKNINDESEKENSELYIRLVAYYEKEKPYLNSKLKASEIAKVLQVSQRNISTVLKLNNYTNFNSFNNKYRVEEVKILFEDPSCEILKMEAIASKAGFGNKQSFYLAFEEYTGLNPGFYRAEILK